jgi:hypothetical protein
LGLRSAAPGFAKVSFEPYFCHDGSIHSAKGYYDSVSGRIDVEWEKKGEIFTYRVTLPEEMERSFSFPEMKILSEKKEGNTHTFELMKG